MSLNCGHQCAHAHSPGYIYMSMESYGGIILTGENQRSRRKPDPEPLCPPQIPHGLTSGHTLSYSTWKLGRAMAQAVGRWPPTARPGFAPGSIHVGFVVGKVALGQVFFRVLRFSPVSIIPPSFHLRPTKQHIIITSVLS
jgi:hypothetical protein